MNYAQKSELVLALARDMGLHGGAAKSQSSNFDAATGTLYVGSKVYTPDQIEQARNLMHSLIEKYRPIGDDTYQLFEIAEHTILMAQKLTTENKGRIVIREN